MANPRKRKSEEMDVSEMRVYLMATVHGVFIGDVSPVSTGKRNSDVKCFGGKFSHGNKVARIVSFDPNLRAEIEEAKEGGQEVAIANCAVKSKIRPGMEIVVNNRMKLVVSKKILTR